MDEEFALETEIGFVRFWTRVSISEPNHIDKKNNNNKNVMSFNCTFVFYSQH
jgi:hypothetical protein